jgi:hypothetical protein
MRGVEVALLDRGERGEEVVVSGRRKSDAEEVGAVDLLSKFGRPSQGPIVVGHLSPGRMMRDAGVTIRLHVQDHRALRP